jgi:hypothetical protein
MYVKNKKIHAIAQMQLDMIWIYGMILANVCKKIKNTCNY